jgi:hypothetical protein
LRSILIEKYIKPSYAGISIFGSYIERWENEFGCLHHVLGHPAEVSYKEGKVIEKYFRRENVGYEKSCFSAAFIYFNEEIIEKWWYKNGIVVKQENY